MRDLIYFLLLIMLSSCTAENTTDKTSNELENTVTNRGDGNIGLKCKGDCDCSLMGTIQSGTPVVECSCSDCSMHITMQSLEGEETSGRLENATYEVEFLEELESYIHENFNTKEYVINEIEIQTHETGVAYLYNFSTTEIDDETVLFARDNNDDKWTVTCIGSCECRERFTFSTPPSASCTCDPCDLIVVKG